MIFSNFWDSMSLKIDTSLHTFKNKTLPRRSLSLGGSAEQSFATFVCFKAAKITQEWLTVPNSGKIIKK